MSLPKFNLSKLRKSIVDQQSVTKKDIRNLLLLDRLQAQVKSENNSRKISNLKKFPKTKYYLDIAYKIEGKVFYLSPESNGQNFIIENGFNPEEIFKTILALLYDMSQPIDSYFEESKEIIHPIRYTFDDNLKSRIISSTLRTIDRIDVWTKTEEARQRVFKYYRIDPETKWAILSEKLEQDINSNRNMFRNMFPDKTSFLDWVQQYYSIELSEKYIRIWLHHADFESMNKLDYALYEISWSYIMAARHTLVSNDYTRYIAKNIQFSFP